MNDTNLRKMKPKSGAKNDQIGKEERQAENDGEENGLKIGP